MVKLAVSNAADSTESGSRERIGHCCLLSLRQGPQDLGTWKALPVESFKAFQREIDSVNVFSHPGDLCDWQVMVTASSSVAAGRRATSVGAAGAGAGVLFRFQKVNSGRERLSRRTSSEITQERSIQFSGISLASKAVKFPLEWHREIQQNHQASVEEVDRRSSSAASVSVESAEEFLFSVIKLDDSGEIG